MNDKEKLTARWYCAVRRGERSGREHLDFSSVNSNIKGTRYIAGMGKGLVGIPMFGDRFPVVRIVSINVTEGEIVEECK